jgi:hypothetical protein
VIEVGDCQVWAIDSQYHIYRWQDEQWVQSPGHLMHISVGYGPMLWGVDQGNDVWYKMLGTPRWEDTHTRTKFDEIATPNDVKMVYLDVGTNGHVWALDDSYNLYWREGITEELIQGTEFTVRDYSRNDYGNFVGLGYCTNGHVWAINEAGQLYFKQGIEIPEDEGVYEDLILQGTPGWTLDDSAAQAA